MHASWPLWLFAAALVILPVVLRFCAAAEPDNAHVHESTDEQPQEGSAPADGSVSAARSHHC